MQRTFSLLRTLALLAGAMAVLAQDVGVAELSRQVKAERARKGPSRAPVFTNDNLPSGSSGGFSMLGASAAAGGAAAADADAAANEGEKKDEAYFREKFAEIRGKIDTTKREINLLEREYNLARTQNYQDPNQAVREQYSNNPAGGKELQEIRRKIDEKKAELSQQEAELSALEDELRAEGGDPAWAR